MFDIVLNGVLAVGVVYSFFMAFVMHTKNIRSALLFKVAPFTLGVALAIRLLLDFGIIINAGG